MNIDLANEAETLALGKAIALLCPQQHFVIHLEGELGAGKTTFSRGFLQALGHKGNVKSPTYALVEPYNISGRSIFHFDLYRVSDPEELDYLGLEDYFTDTSLCLIEWPQQGQGILPPPDLNIQFNYQNDARTVQLSAISVAAKKILNKLKF